MKLILSVLFFIFGSVVFSQNKAPAVYFSNYEIVTLDAQELFDYCYDNSNSIIRIQLDKWDLQLEVVDMFSEDYKSVSSSGKVVTSTKNRAIPLRGYTNIGGRAYITIAKDFVYGFIDENGVKFNIEPFRYYSESAKQNQFIVYTQEDVIPTSPKTCGVTEEHNMTSKVKENNNRLLGLCYEIEYGICNDESYVTKYGSIANAENQVIGVVNNINANYNDEFDDELKFVISGQYSINIGGSDPWTSSTDAYVLLPDFRTWSLANLNNPPINIAHDVASLWTNRDFDGSTVGLAYIGGACGSYRYNVLQDYTGSVQDIRVMTAHELGHNFGSDHDPASGSTTYIMEPSVDPNAVTWSPLSKSEIEDHYTNNSGCFDICVGSTPQINFGGFTSTASENDADGTAGPCAEGYVDHTITVTTSIAPASNVVVNISVNGGTATEDYDYELITTSVTFTAAGSLSKDVTIRIYDDVIEEEDETIMLSISISSGTADIGGIDDHTITIPNLDDEVLACTTTSDFNIGSYQLSFVAFFNGEFTDSRTRMLLKADQLTNAGLVAGNINKLSLYVQQKNSTNPFLDYRIGMFLTNDNNLGSTWYTTEEVFIGDYTTAVGWNDFVFTNNFYWDGVSNIYVDYCFNNSTTSDNDLVRGHNLTGFGQSVSFVLSNSNDGCTLVPGSNNYYSNIHPNMKLRQVIGSEPETIINSTSFGRVKVGELAHFYSNDGKIMATIKNTGFVDIDCMDIFINTEGNNKSNLPFGTYEYTNKTFQIDADNDANYQLTLYYTQGELATWGVDKLNLNFIKSSSVISSSTAMNSEFINTIESQEGIGCNNSISYRTSTSGSGFFALTDGEKEEISCDISNGDLVFNTIADGLLLKNETGSQYVFTIDNMSEIDLTLNNGANPSSVLYDSDLNITTATKGIIFKVGASSYAKLTVNNDGDITINSTALPTTRITHETGYLKINDNGGGIVLKNSQNECWKVYVDNLGNLDSYQVACY